MTHLVRPVTFFIFVDVSQGCQRGKERKFRVDVWLGLFWGKRTKSWQALLECPLGRGWEKAGDRALEWENQKETRLCGLGTPIRHSWPPEATCKAQGGCPFTQLTVSNRARPALEIFRTFHHCGNTLQFLVVPFLYPYIIDQRHCIWFPHEVHCACSAGWPSSS